ncbi:MAG: phosphatidylglycerol lysyltransferase domain-containing protein [Vicinamibacterales bacterium]
MASSDSTGSPTAERLRRLVRSYGWNTNVYQILNPGLRYWFDPERPAVVGYAGVGRWRVVAGAPVSREGDLAAVVEAFEADAARAGHRVCYFGAEERLAGVCLGTATHAGVLVGAQPMWDPARWAAVVASKKSLRAQLARARNKQVTVERWDHRNRRTVAEVGECLIDWLEAKRMPPLGFMTTPWTLGHLRDRQVHVARNAEGRVVGFLLASPVPARRGWLFEQIVRRPGAPNGTAELLVDAGFRQAAENGAAFVTLGLAPLSTRAGSDAPWWLTPIFGASRRWGRWLYDFAGLDQFKAKFQPTAWVPVYIIVRGRRVSPGMMVAVGKAFAETGLAAFAARTAGHTVRRLRVERGGGLAR